MRLVDLKIDGFGKLNNRYIDFSEGINLVTGHNEAGKSTLHACIRAMFYGMERAKGIAALTDTYAHYKPWNGKAYGAKLRIENDGRIYSITRDFNEDPVGCKIYDETGMEPVMLPEEFLNSILCGLNAGAYDNTISIGQLQSTADTTMAKELKKFIVNMDTTGNRSLNCTLAKQYLGEQKRRLAEEIVPEAAKTLAANTGELRNLEKETGNPDYICKLYDLEDEKKENDAETAELKSEAEKLETGIVNDRGRLEKHGAKSSNQIESEKENFNKVLKDYEDEAAKKTIVTCRTLYIVALVLSIAAVVATAYIMGTGENLYIIRYCLGIAAACLIIALIFIALTIAARARLSKKKKALSELLVKYSGFGDVLQERIDRVKLLLEQLSTLASDVENREVQLTDLGKKNEDITKRGEKLEDEISVQKDIRSELMGKLERMNQLRRDNEELKVQIAKNEEINDNIEAIDIAIQTIDDLAVRMKNSLGVFLNAEASRYIREITDGAYDSLTIDDNMDVFMNTSTKMVPIEQVSSGTSDQIYMALRLAAARLVQNGEDKLPLIFDDSFVNYDEHRLTSALEWLAGEYKGQIIIFSCHKREEQILEEKEAEYNKIKI